MDVIAEKSHLGELVSCVVKGPHRWCVLNLLCKVLHCIIIVIIVLTYDKTPQNWCS